MNDSVDDCNSASTFEGDRLSCSMNDECNSNVQKTDKVKQKDVAEKDPPVSQKIKLFVEPGPIRRGIRVSEVWPLLSKGKKKGEPVTWDDLDAYADTLASKKKRRLGKDKNASGSHNAAGGGDNISPPPGAGGGDNVPPPPGEVVRKGKKVRWADLEAGKQSVKHYSLSEEDNEEDDYYLMKNGKDFYYYNTGPDCEEQPNDEDPDWKP